MGVVSEENETLTVTNTAKLIEQIGSLYLNERFSDLTLNINGEKLFAHKVILAVRSLYFERLLYGENSDLTEITINNVSSNIFKKLLKYIYTGRLILVPSNIEITLEVLAFTHEYAFTELGKEISQKLKSLINLNNVCSILNTANLYTIDDLRESCHLFLDNHASEIINSDHFNELTAFSIMKLLERDTFVVPEITIFKSIAKWYKINNVPNVEVIHCVRLSCLTIVEIVSVVWPSKLFDNEELLTAIAEIVNVKPKKTNCRALLLPDKNLASVEQKAEVLTGVNTGYLLTGNRNVSHYASQNIGDKNGITIKLKAPMFINHIYMMLWDADSRWYSYYIEISVDQENWKKVIDYTAYSCRSHQYLYFQPEAAQYIRVVGTHNTANTIFHLIFFEVYYKNDIPRLVNGIVCPTTNVATSDKKASVIEGTSPNELLDGDTIYDGSTGFSWHTIGSGHITVQLAQPYLISSMKLLLWDKDDRFYKYYIETSVNKIDWKLAVDHRQDNCKSWQIIRFEERPVVYIRIIGTHNSANNGFHCVHFECPITE